MSEDQVINLLLISSLPGAFGGVVAFLLSLKEGHYIENKYIAKLTIEILGGSILASFVGPLFSETVQIKLFLAFALGVTWGGIIQVARSKITKIVKTAIGENFS